MNQIMYTRTYTQADELIYAHTGRDMLILSISLLNVILRRKFASSLGHNNEMRSGGAKLMSLTVLKSLPGIHRDAPYRHQGTIRTRRVSNISAPPTISMCLDDAKWRNR